MRAGRIEKIDIMFSELRCGIEISLAECRTATALAIFRKRNFKPERFQNFYRSDSDVRFVVAHECIIPKNDFASGRDAALQCPDIAARCPYLSSCKPAIESFVRVLRQRTPSGNTERFFHKRPQRPEIQ